jgi:hypothetical protein
VKYGWWVSPEFRDTPWEGRQIPLAVIYVYEHSPYKQYYEFNPPPLTTFEKVIQSKWTKFFFERFIPFCIWGAVGWLIREAVKYT